MLDQIMLQVVEAVSELKAAAKPMATSFHTVKLPVGARCTTVFAVARRVLDLQPALMQGCKQSPDVFKDVEAPR